MNPCRHLFQFSFFACIIGIHAAAQTDSTAVKQDTTYTLVDKTLLTNQDIKIVVGQPVVIGEASGEEGWYQTITFRNSTAWPLLLFRDLELSQNVDYQLDESIRARDKIKSFLAKGDTLTVTKIKRYRHKRSGKNWYVVTMRADQGVLSLNFRCYIIDAVRLGEVIVPKR